MSLTFVTGNAHKAEKAAKLLGRDLQHVKLDLDELQTTDLDELVEHKVRQAYEEVGSPVIVDDFGFGFTALNGLPGPFTKYFIGSPDGPEMMCRMVDSFDDRSATVSSAIGYYDGTTLKIFIRSLDGTTAEHPRGSNGIDTDRIFIPVGYDQTRAELDDEEYDKVYAMVRPYDELRQFLDTIDG
jgi:non-canonical purine NTP pyrophosphatase (RdgB/HAM1 family)